MERMESASSDDSSQTSDGYNVPPELIEKMICTLCIGVFRRPKILPCAHTFCRRCLNQLIFSHIDDSYFTCPNCRNLTWIPLDGVDGFPNNFYLIEDLLEVARETDGDNLYLDDDEDEDELLNVQAPLGVLPSLQGSHPPDILNLENGDVSDNYEYYYYDNDYGAADAHRERVREMRLEGADDEEQDNNEPRYDVAEGYRTEQGSEGGQRDGQDGHREDVSASHRAAAHIPSRVRPVCPRSPRRLFSQDRLTLRPRFRPNTLYTIEEEDETASTTSFEDNDGNPSQSSNPRPEIERMTIESSPPRHDNQPSHIPSLAEEIYKRCCLRRRLIAFLDRTRDQNVPAATTTGGGSFLPPLPPGPGACRNLTAQPRSSVSWGNNAQQGRETGTYSLRRLRLEAQRELERPTMTFQEWWALHRAEREQQRNSSRQTATDRRMRNDREIEIITYEPLDLLPQQAGTDRQRTVGPQPAQPSRQVSDRVMISYPQSCNRPRTGRSEISATATQLPPIRHPETGQHRRTAGRNSRNRRRQQNGRGTEASEAQREQQQDGPQPEGGGLRRLGFQ